MSTREDGRTRGANGRRPRGGSKLSRAAQRKSRVAARRAWQSSRLGPLVSRLVDGFEDARTALESVVGPELAGRAVEALQRTLHRDARTPYRECKQGKAGQRVGKRFGARARFRAVHPVRSREHVTVAKAVALFLCVLNHMRAGNVRVWHRALWLGRDGAPWEKAGGLASRLRVSTRTLQRYFAALRDVGLLKNWQPLKRNAQGEWVLPENAPLAARTATGRCYSCYELAFEPTLALQEWWGCCARKRAEDAAAPVNAFAADVADLLAELDAAADRADGGSTFPGVGPPE